MVALEDKRQVRTLRTQGGSATLSTGHGGHETPEYGEEPGGTYFRFPRAAVKMYHTLGVVKHRHVVSCSSAGWKSSSKMLARLIPLEAQREILLALSRWLPAVFAVPL